MPLLSLPGLNRPRASLVPLPAAIAEDLAFPGPLARGQKGREVRALQEWLVLAGAPLALDGIFGAATEASLKAFQTGARLKATGRLDARTHAALTAKLRGALSLPATRGAGLADLALSLAEAHLAAGAAALAPAPGTGPFARLYLGGREGSPITTAFLLFVIAEAARSLHLARPLHDVPSPAALAEDARGRGLLIPAREAASAAARAELLRPGLLFILRDGRGAPVGAGLVRRLGAETFTTIEAAPPDPGPGDPLAVTSRLRAIEGKDFILLPDQAADAG